MPTPNRSSDRWQEAFKIINKCPICSATYPQQQIKVFATEESAQILHLTCGACHSFFVAMIVLLGNGISSMGMVTDLSYRDVQRLHGQESFTLDEALVGYEAIENAQFQF